MGVRNDYDLEHFDTQILQWPFSDDETCVKKARKAQFRKQMFHQTSFRIFLVTLVTLPSTVMKVDSDFRTVTISVFLFYYTTAKVMCTVSVEILGNPSLKLSTVLG